MMFSILTWVVLADTVRASPSGFVSRIKTFSIFPAEKNLPTETDDDGVMILFERKLLIKRGNLHFFKLLTL